MPGWRLFAILADASGIRGMAAGQAIDLAVTGGALPVNDPKQWGNDWFWAPEVYFNPRTRLYYMFYAARSDANKASWFGYADFEEPSKTGVAIGVGGRLPSASRSPLAFPTGWNCCSQPGSWH